MSDTLKRLFPTLSKPASRGWTLAIVFVLLLIIVLQYDEIGSERLAMRFGPVRAAAKLRDRVRDGKKTALIELAGELANPSGLNIMLADAAQDALPELPAIEPPKQAEWIVEHYGQLQFDAGSNTFHLQATTKPSENEPGA